MARVCEICQKGYLKGNLVPRGIGNRVTNRAIIMRQPNLQMKRITIDGITKRFKICTSCLKRIKFEKNLLAKQAAAAN